MACIEFLGFVVSKEGIETSLVKKAGKIKFCSMNIPVDFDDTQINAFYRLRRMLAFEDVIPTTQTTTQRFYGKIKD